MFTSRFKFLVASLTVAIAANSFADTGGQSTTGTPITGLYDALGNSLTTAISLTGASYTITYNDVNNLPNQWVFSLPSGTLTTTIKLHFTASGWRAYTTASVGIQIANYDCYGSETAPSYNLLSYLNGTPVLPPVPSNTAPHYNLTWSVVDPLQFNITTFTVDSSDPTGKTGTVTFNSTVSSPYPWGSGLNSPAWPVTVYSPPNPGETFSYFGVIWLFPQFNNTGVSIGWPHTVYPVTGGGGGGAG